MEGHNITNTEIYTAIVATLGFAGVVFQAVMSYLKEGRERRWKLEDRAYQDKRAAEVKAEAKAAASQVASVAARSANLVVSKIEDSKKERRKEKEEIIVAVADVKEQAKVAFDAANGHNEKIAANTALAVETLAQVQKAAATA